MNGAFVLVAALIVLVLAFLFFVAYITRPKP